MSDSVVEKDDSHQRGEEYTHLRFFAHKVGIITDSARIISFTTSGYDFLRLFIFFCALAERHISLSVFLICLLSFQMIKKIT